VKRIREDTYYMHIPYLDIHNTFYLRTQRSNVMVNDYKDQFLRHFQFSDTFHQ
jgi:hypothetical protein